MTCFEKTSFELKVTEILKIKLQYLKIQIPVTTKRVILQNFRLSPALLSNNNNNNNNNNK